NERQVLRILNGRRLGKLANRLRQQVGEIRHLDALWNLRLRLLGRVNDRLFVLHLLPLETLLAAGGIEALTVLPGCVEQAPRYLGHNVVAFDLEGGVLDGKGVFFFLDWLLADAARAVTDHTLGQGRLARLAQDGKARTDTMRGIVHRRQARPVIGPA